MTELIAGIHNHVEQPSLSKHHQTIVFSIVSSDTHLFEKLTTHYKHLPQVCCKHYADIRLIPAEYYTASTLLIAEQDFLKKTRVLSRFIRSTKMPAAIICDLVTVPKIPDDINKVSLEALKNISADLLPAFITSLRLSGMQLFDTRKTQKIQQTTQAVSETVQRFFELPLLGMVRLDTDGIVQEVNQTFVNLVQSSPEALLHSNFISSIHSKSKNTVRHALSELIAGKNNTTQLELRCRQSPTKSRYCIGSFAVVRNVNEEIESILVALLDITDRRNAEKELKNKEMYLRQVIDIIPHLVFAKDKEGRFTLVNQAVAQLFGKEIRDLIGKKDRELNPFDDECARFKKEDERVLSEGAHLVIPEEPLHHLSTDSIRWYQTIKKPIRNADGIATEVLGVATDLTERRRAEHALRSIVSGTASKTAEEFFRSLACHLAEVLNTRFAFIAEKIPGSNQARMLAFWEDGNFLENITYGLDHSPTGAIFGKELKLFERHVCRLFPDDPFLKKHSMQSYMGAPIFSATGKPLGVLAVMDTKPMAEWLPAQSILKIFSERAGAELDRLAHEQETRELQHQLLQSQKMEAIGQLAAGIAHDLNNALGAVVGHLQLIKSTGTPELEIETSVDIALSGCERATSLIEHLLGFSRQGKYNLESLSLKKVIEDTTTFLGRVVGKDILIKIVEKEPHLHILADHGQMQQALTNLIINAKQAMPEGGSITFTLQSEHILDPKRFNSKAAPGTFAKIMIADTGTGIPSHLLEKVFEPFFSTKGEGVGTGLGLSMVYGTMQNHGGWVTVESHADSGTEFSLYIPLTNTRVLNAVAGGGVNVEATPTGYILVIDDEPYLVDLALTFLKRNGMQGIGFTNPNEAVIWYRTHHTEVDLIVLDMKMPELNGAECFDLLKAIDSEASIAILSGYSHDEAAQSVLDKGAIHFFQKPLKYPELMYWIKEYLA